MATLRNVISDVRGMHKILSTDSLITDRVIASEIRSTSLLLIKRETNLRKLWATDTIFTTIPCIEMVEVPLSECCAYQGDDTIARTKYKERKIDTYIKWTINKRGYLKWKDLIEIHNKYNIKCYE